MSEPVSDRCPNCGSPNHDFRDCPVERKYQESLEAPIPCATCGSLLHETYQCLGPGSTIRRQVDRADTIARAIVPILVLIGVAALLAFLVSSCTLRPASIFSVSTCPPLWTCVPVPTISETPAP